MVHPVVRNPVRSKGLPEGTRVKFQFGPYSREGTIVEDRGHLGGGGRRLYGIQFEMEGERYIELSPDEFTVITDASPTVGGGTPA